MQNTSKYLDPSRVAGADVAAGLAWLRRQDAWDRRLRALDASHRSGDDDAPRPPAAAAAADRAAAGSPAQA
jgi:hypothetical protein